jgi:uncharacterized damage-inducible protein DinB
MDPRHALLDTIVYLSPLKVLEGLSPAAAAERPPSLPHSIGEIVAHLSFWQEWFTRRFEGRNEPVVASAALGWPPIPPGSWHDVEARFRQGLETLVALAEGRDLNSRLQPAIDFEPLSQYTLGDVIHHVAQHNAHHLGQVVMLRQLAGTWPPPGGSWTW